MCTALADIPDRTFWMLGWCCFIWNIRRLLISSEVSDLHAGMTNFLLCRPKWKIYKFCFFFVFSFVSDTVVMLSCNYCFSSIYCSICVFPGANDGLRFHCSYLRTLVAVFQHWYQIRNQHPLQQSVVRRTRNQTCVSARMIKATRQQSSRRGKWQRRSTLKTRSTTCCTSSGTSCISDGSFAHLSLLRPDFSARVLDLEFVLIKMAVYQLFL